MINTSVFEFQDGWGRKTKCKRNVEPSPIERKERSLPT